MLYLLFFALMLLGFAFFFTGILKKDLTVIMCVLACAVFFILSIPSFAIEIPFCLSNSTQSWSCFVYSHNSDYAISYFFLAMGLVSLVLVAYSIVYGFGEQISNPPGEPREI